MEDRVFNPNLVHPFGYNQFKLIRNGGEDGLQKLQYLIEAKQFPSSSALLEACSDAISLPESLVLGVLVEMLLLPRKNQKKRKDSAILCAHELSMARRLGEQRAG